jgi:acetoin utilization protein AcuB
LNVAKVMSREVIAVDVDTPLEEAARLMADHDIGGLPVTQEDKLVGIITESDVFRIFVELFAARQKGVRLTAVFPDVRGELAKVSAAIAEAGGDILAFGTVHEEETDKALGAIKVSGIGQEKLVALVEPFVDRLVDVREV